MSRRLRLTGISHRAAVDGNDGEFEPIGVLRSRSRRLWHGRQRGWRPFLLPSALVPGSGVCALAERKRYTPLEAAKVLGISEVTLEKWRSRRFGPPFGKVGRRIFYPAIELEQWLDAQVLDPSQPKI